MAKNKNLSIRLSSFKSALLVVLLYFCIFSMLYSTLILSAFAVSVLLYRFFALSRPKEKLLPKFKRYCAHVLKEYNIAVTVIAGTVISMLLELTGGRAAWDSGNTFFGSVFSFEYIGRVFTSAKYLLSGVSLFNVLVAVMFVCIVGISVALWVANRKKEGMPLVAISVKICFLSGLCFGGFNIALSAKAGPFLSSYIDYSFGLFFYIILLISLATLYILKKSPFVRLFFPLIVIFVILIAVDSKWPYTDSFYGEPGSGIYGQTAAKTAFINSCIEQVVEAGVRGESSVLLAVPKYGEDGGNWPITPWWADSLSDTLYSHRITAEKTEILLVIDENMPAP
jgi:hypothetical protein